MPITLNRGTTAKLRVMPLSLTKPRPKSSEFSNKSTDTLDMRNFKTIVITTLTILTLQSQRANAEYRAFELNINDTEKGTTRIVKSTLDHLQYPKLHPVRKNEVIEYVDSWMCYENMSNFRPICAKPERTAASDSTATNATLTTTPLLKPNSTQK
jgi:hypothetical protein